MQSLHASQDGRFQKQRWTTQTFENPVAIKGKERLSFAGATLNKPTKASFRNFFFFNRMYLTYMSR